MGFTLLQDTSSLIVDNWFLPEHSTRNVSPRRKDYLPRTLLKKNGMRYVFLNIDIVNKCLLKYKIIVCQRNDKGMYLISIGTKVIFEQRGNHVVRSSKGSCNYLIPIRLTVRLSVTLKCFHIHYLQFRIKYQH